MNEIAYRPKLPFMLRGIVALDIFVGLTALAGGLGLMLGPDGDLVGLPPVYLRSTPFSDYFWPGAILTVIVGGSSLAAGLAHVLRKPLAGQLTFLAELILIGWIAGQVALVGYLSWLQPTYALLGVGQVVLIIVALVRASGPSPQTGS